MAASEIGRVEQAVIRQRFGQAAVDREGAAPIAILFAERDHGGVDREAVQHGFEERVADVVRLHLRNGLAASVGVRILPRICCTRGLSAMSCRNSGARSSNFSTRWLENITEPTSSESGATRGLASRSIGQRNISKIAASIAACARSSAASVTTPVLKQLAAEGADGIGLLPALDLLFGAIARSVGRRVAADAVGDGIEQHRAAAFEEQLLLAAERVDDGQRIVAVDAFGMHLLGIDARADARDELARPWSRPRLPAHAVEIVHAVEDDRQAAAQRFVPQLAVLVHRGEGDAFPHRTAAERGVADVGDHDAGLAVHPLEQRRAGRDRARAAHDRVVGIDAERREEGVHGAAESAIEAGFAREDLAVRAVDEEAQGQALHRPAVSLLDGPQQRAIAVGPHDLHQLRIAQLADGGKSFGQDLAVAAVRAEDMVVGRQARTPCRPRRLPVRSRGAPGRRGCRPLP